MKTDSRGGRTPGILIVDDNPANLQLLYGMLKKSGYLVRPVPNGTLALEAAAKTPPDLILLDINMPGVDGYEVCRRLKADERLKDVPVIFISAHNETPDKLKAFSVGGVDYVTKPFHFEEVEARVATHLKIREQKQQLEASYEQLRKLEVLRDSLVHMIVHDLRSPLMGVDVCLQTLEMIEKDNISERAAKLLREAATTTDRLIEMVGSLLDVSKMESNALQLDLSPREMSDLVKGAIAKAGPLKGRRNFKTDLPKASVELVCDGDLVQRVMQNLLANAFQFTPEECTIRVAVEPDGELVRVSVHDDGPGIPAEFHEKIFEKFGQVDMGSGKRKFTTGLGLTFCKLAVEAHGGSIGVTSEPGRGSTFWFILPKKGPSSTAIVRPAAD